MGHSWLGTEPSSTIRKYGLPLGPMERKLGDVITTRFTHCEVSIDCDTLKSEFEWRSGMESME
jgi:hypothetical protein